MIYDINKCMYYDICVYGNMKNVIKGDILSFCLNLKYITILQRFTLKYF